MFGEMSYTVAIFLLSFGRPCVQARGVAMVEALSEDYSLTGKVMR